VIRRRQETKEKVMSETPQPVLQAKEITRTYPGVTALKGVDISLYPGRVTALVGENGAGKSTLIRIIGGLESPTSGTLSVRANEIAFSSAHDSQAAGISVVSQEFRLVPQLTVAENIYLGHEITVGGLISRRRSRERAHALLQELGLELDPDRRVDSLTVGDQQLVEITRALSREFDVLVMDEPSAALNGAEVERLLALVRRLRDSGKAVLYVSHHLDEIFAVADNITVFRDGERVADLETGSTSEPELVELMLGRTLEVQPPSAIPATQRNEAPLLEAEDLSCVRVSDPVSFVVRPGEIVGLAGLVGSGRSEVMRTLFGVLPARSGRVRIGGSEIRLDSPGKAIAAGMFMLSEDRKADGILPHLSVLENLVITEKRSRSKDPSQWVPTRKREESTYQRLKKELRVRVDSPGQLIGNLSGGNQQKVLFGRALLSGCRVLLLNEPTRGVDVGAKVEIYQLIEKLAASGVAVLVSSSEAPELAVLAHRCMVLYAGRVTAELHGEDVNETNIVAASVGQNIKGAI
jgi:ABC-type sugar transport system ATPase subunit